MKLHDDLMAMMPLTSPVQDYFNRLADLIDRVDDQTLVKVYHENLWSADGRTAEQLAASPDLADRTHHLTVVEAFIEIELKIRQLSI